MSYSSAFLLFIFSTFALVWLVVVRDHLKKDGTFSQGDIVTAFGNRGIVKSISDNGYVIVKFDDFESTVVFNLDGRLMKWHKEVSLKHV